MPTLEFKGKQHIYAHHLTVPYRPLDPDETRSCNLTDTDDNFIIDIALSSACGALKQRFSIDILKKYPSKTPSPAAVGALFTDEL